MSAYNLIIEASVIIILSFFFSLLSKKTNIPSVLMLIVLGIGLQIGLSFTSTKIDFFPILELLGIVGLIMIVLEAALELKLDREKILPIGKAFFTALAGLLLSAWGAAALLKYFIPELSHQQSWIYATPLSILSSAIIIPSVSNLRKDKKEFHIYESTFSDILGIMLFYFLVDQGHSTGSDFGLLGFSGNIALTLLVSLVASYSIVLIFQNITSNVKLFLLIAVLLLFYALGKKFHLSSLLIILIFGLLIANMKLFFVGGLQRYLNYQKAQHIYEELHTITLETAFVVRTFFFVIFGITISLESLLDANVALVSLLLIVSIYLIRLVLLRFTVGKDMFPQSFVAPRGLITILLFYAIPEEIQYEGFNSGILLFVIIGTSLIMTLAMIIDKNRSVKAIEKAKSIPIGTIKWTARSIEK